MEQQNNDLRVIKTEKAIKQAMISLLYTNSFDKITVTDISKKAMINRNTFYLHYIDKADLLEHIIEDDYLSHRGMLEGAVLIDYRYKENPEEYIYSIIKKVLDEVSKVRKFYEMIANNETTKVHLIRILNNFKTNLRKKYSDNDIKKTIALEYIYSALSGAFFTWLAKGNNFASIEEISRTLAKMLYNSFNCIYE